MKVGNNVFQISSDKQAILSNQRDNNSLATNPIKSENVLSFYGSKTTEVDKALKALKSNINFTGKLIDGVMYSNKALMLGEAMISPEQAKAMYQASIDKKAEINAKKAENKGYNNARAGVVEAATVLGQNGATYTATDVDFFSSRWGMQAGMLASCMAMNDLNDSVKAIALTDENHDRKSLQWLANTSPKLNKTRGGRGLQVVTARKLAGGKVQLQVRTLVDVPGFVPNSLPKIKPDGPNPDSGIKEYKPENVQIKDIVYSDKAKAAAEKLAKEKGLNADDIVKRLILTSQDQANKLDKKIVESKGNYDNAPVSHYRYISAVLGDNDKVYTGYNTEFYDNGFMADVMCSERTSISKAVNDGANKIYAIAINNNQNHSDAPCAECLGWMSTSRAGKDLMIATIIRDDAGNKTDKVEVRTLSELLTDIHVPSAKVK